MGMNKIIAGALQVICMGELGSEDCSDKGRWGVYMDYAGDPLATIPSSTSKEMQKFMNQGGFQRFGSDLWLLK